MQAPLSMFQLDAHTLGAAHSGLGWMKRRTCRKTLLSLPAVVPAPRKSGNQHPPFTTSHQFINRTQKATIVASTERLPGIMLRAGIQRNTSYQPSLYACSSHSRFGSWVEDQLRFQGVHKFVQSRVVLVYAPRRQFHFYKFSRRLTTHAYEGGGSLCMGLLHTSSQHKVISLSDENIPKPP